MTGWLKYCQSKGLCPDCVKGLCMCSKAVSKVTADIANVGHGGARRHRLATGDDVVVNYPDHPLHGRQGVAESLPVETSHAAIYNIRFGNDVHGVHCYLLNPVRDRVRRGLDPATGTESVPGRHDAEREQKQGEFRRRYKEERGE